MGRGLKTSISSNKPHTGLVLARELVWRTRFKKQSLFHDFDDFDCTEPLVKVAIGWFSGKLCVLDFNNWRRSHSMGIISFVGFAFFLSDLDFIDCEDEMVFTLFPSSSICFFSSMTIDHALTSFSYTFDPGPWYYSLASFARLNRFKSKAILVLCPLLHRRPALYPFLSYPSPPSIPPFLPYPTRRSISVVIAAYALTSLPSQQNNQKSKKKNKKEQNTPIYSYPSLFQCVSDEMQQAKASSSD